jgi:hypothetical protein
MSSNPNYAELFEQYRLETDPFIKEQILDQIYVFNEPLTIEEAQLFGYVYDGYIENDPGVVDGVFSSYVGVYINQEGVYTGNYP